MNKISFLNSENSTLEEALLCSSSLSKLNLGRTFVRKLIVAGRVYVNGKRIRSPNARVLKNQHVDVFVDESRLPERKTEQDFLPLRVLYEDEAVICFDKPAGLPSQPTVDEKRANLYDLAKDSLAKQTGSKVYLGMHHRLDKDTSGVILFTRGEQYNAFIADQFKEHHCSKTYVAVVHGSIKNQKGRLESFLGEAGKSGKIQKYGTVKSGGKKAITDFQVLKSTPQASLVEVQIKTGRTHQIRVHFSEMGHPIMGDTLYGSPVENYNKLGRFLLHAHALTIAHPESKNLIRVESPIPPELRL